MKTTARYAVPMLAWHSLAILALACLPVIKFAAPWWSISKRELLPAVLLIGAYALSALIATMLIRGEGRAAAGRALLATMSVFALCLFGMLLLDLAIPRYLLLPIFVAAVVLIPLSKLGPRARRLGWLAPSIASAAALLFTVRVLAFQPATPGPEIERSFVNTAFYTLQVTTYKHLIPKPATRGGGLDHLGDRVLLGTGDGHLYLLDLAASPGAIDVQALPTIVPANREAFAAAFGGSARSPTRSVEWTDQGPPRVQTWRFRIADVVARERGNRVQLYASHHYWHPDAGCFVVRVSTIEGASANLAESLRDAQWQTLYETSPCVPLTGERRMRGKNPFKGEEVGGRLAFLDDDALLLTVGDHGFHGLASHDLFAQDPNGAYGKTMRIDLRSGHAEVFTVGHRNPQGLYIGADGRMWLTEHGSQGGDELNLLAQGANYGWPLVTYGTDYGAMVWPLNQEQSRHDGFVQPIYAWTPSIGVSNLIQMAGDALPIWRGNLIAGSLATRSLYRLVLDGDRIVLSEPISLDKRVRDLLELADGRLLVWSDDGSLLLIEQASGLDGAASFASLCLGCHTINDGLAHRIGPDLFGVVGRSIGDAQGYDEFSAALRAHSGRWTREHLDAFLRNPQAFAPGTTMAFAGIEDAEQRTQLIEYLANPNGGGKQR